MNCPKCGKNTAVVDSRSGDETRPKYAWLVSQGKSVYGWWSPEDFRMRRRKCTKCKHEALTIEVELSDLDKAFTDISSG